MGLKPFKSLVLYCLNDPISPMILIALKFSFWPCRFPLSRNQNRVWKHCGQGLLSNPVRRKSGISRISPSSFGLDSSIILSTSSLPSSFQSTFLGKPKSPPGFCSFCWPGLIFVSKPVPLTKRTQILQNSRHGVNFQLFFRVFE